MKAISILTCLFLLLANFAVAQTPCTLPVNAGNDVTINEGENVTLSATGAMNYSWSPGPHLKYFNTPNPDAEPIITTTYYVTGTDTSGCVGKDTLVVNVIPSDTLVFYNTFTPNGDGNNDSWYIGNLNKYPLNSLKIYNRYGKLIHEERPYKNDWNGRSFGEIIPSATYYFILTPGNGEPDYHGSITIVK